MADASSRPQLRHLDVLFLRRPKQQLQEGGQATAGKYVMLNPDRVNLRGERRRHRGICLVDLPSCPRARHPSRSAWRSGRDLQRRRLALSPAWNLRGSIRHADEEGARRGRRHVARGCSQQSLQGPSPSAPGGGARPLRTLRADRRRVLRHHDDAEGVLEYRSPRHSAVATAQPRVRLTSAVPIATTSPARTMASSMKRTMASSRRSRNSRPVARLDQRSALLVGQPGHHLDVQLRRLEAEQFVKRVRFSPGSRALATTVRHA
jgi:hypothetical protein